MLAIRKPSTTLALTGPAHAGANVWGPSSRPTGPDRRRLLSWVPAPQMYRRHFEALLLLDDLPPNGPERNCERRVSVIYYKPRRNLRSTADLPQYLQVGFTKYVITKHREVVTTTRFAPHLDLLHPRALRCAQPQRSHRHMYETRWIGLQRFHGQRCLPAEYGFNSSIRFDRHLSACLFMTARRSSSFLLVKDRYDF